MAGEGWSEGGALGGLWSLFPACYPSLLPALPQGKSKWRLICFSWSLGARPHSQVCCGIHPPPWALLGSALCLCALLGLA